MPQRSRERATERTWTLRGIFKKQYLSSGAPATDERVMSTIVFGYGIMPPIGPQPDAGRARGGAGVSAYVIGYKLERTRRD